MRFGTSGTSGLGLGGGMAREKDSLDIRPKFFANFAKGIELKYRSELFRDVSDGSLVGMICGRSCRAHSVAQQLGQIHRVVTIVVLTNQGSAHGVEKAPAN